MSRDRKVWVVVIAGVLAFVVLGNLVYAWANNRETIEGWPDVELNASEVVEFKDTPQRPLHLHLFAPETTPAPTIVLFHGGGLVRTRVAQFVPQAERLVASGYTVALAEYRVTPEGAVRSDIVADANDALAWLRANGAAHGVDTTFVAAGGASAGGWLAAETARSELPPDALVLFNPAVDATDASTNDVPTIVFHSTEDRVVPVGRAEEFCEASVDCTFEMWFTGDHGYFNQDVDEEAFEDTTAKTIAHLDTLTKPA